MKLAYIRQDFGIDNRQWFLTMASMASGATRLGIYD